MDKNTIDLDNFLEELYGEKRSFKLYGKIWTLKQDLPAAIRFALRDDVDVSPEEEIKLFAEILDPPSQFDELMSMGLGSTALDAILRIAFGTYASLTPQEIMDNFKEEKLGKLLKEEKGTKDSNEKKSSS